MKRPLLLLFLVFPIAAIVRALKGEMQEKGPVIAATIILALGILSVGFLFDWPRHLRFKLKPNSLSRDGADPLPGEEAATMSPEQPGATSTIACIRHALGPPPRVLRKGLGRYLRLRRPNWLWYNLTDERTWHIAIRSESANTAR